VKIASVEIQRLRDVPTPRPLRPAWSPGAIKTSASISIIRMRTDDGLEGFGTGGSPKALREVADQLIGCDPFDTERHSRLLRHNGGAWGMELALWDLIGKSCGQPLSKLWGGYTDRVRGYASMVEAVSIGETVERVQGLVAEGFTGVKIRLHHDSRHDDVALATAVRVAVGPDVALMADANQARVPFAPPTECSPVWDLRRARSTARALEELDYLWLEEPLGRNGYAGLAALNGSVDIAIAGGEKNVFLHEFADLIDRSCYDIVQPDALFSEGIGQLRKVAAYAELHHKQCIPHHGGGGIGAFGHLHLAASVPNAPWVEVLRDRAGEFPWPAQLAVREPMMIDSQGWVVAPSQPGLGVELDEDFIKRYAR
jgi:D-galactarolactone cycloisomerase